MRRESRFWTGSSRQRSPVGSRFSELPFLDVPRTSTEQVRTCGFGRNSSSFDRAPKIWDSVLLNCFKSFLVTLPSISSETWEMYSWAISGSSVFCDWLFQVFSGVSLKLFLLISSYSSKLPWYWGIILSAVKTELKFLFL